MVTDEDVLVAIELAEENPGEFGVAVRAIHLLMDPPRFGFSDAVEAIQRVTGHPISHYDRERSA